MKSLVVNILFILLISVILIFITNIDMTSAEATTLANKVISLSQGNSWNAGAVGVYQTNGHEYRYVGAEPNNYVRFNNELYRIIGVFDSNSTGKNDNLVKLIRNRAIGSYSWGVTNDTSTYTTYSTNNSNWNTANANILLNEYFLNATDTSNTYKSCSDWTYYASSNDYKIKNCSIFLKSGIQTEILRKYIEPVTWYLKGYNNSSYSKQNFYTCERSEGKTITNCKSGNDGSYSTKVENKKIGLMYVSDYLYASGYYASSNTEYSSQRYYGQQNWLYGGLEWTITPTSFSGNYVFQINVGNIYINTSPSEFLFRPTFYLKSQVYVTGGDGSFHNPYTIACDDCDE